MRLEKFHRQTDKIVLHSAWKLAFVGNKELNLTRTVFSFHIKQKVIVALQQPL